MTVPKKKMSKSKTHMRRAHDALVVPNVGSCPQCGEPKLSHRVCGSCGHYNGRQIFLVESEDEV
jgi:large subunit ribosomal protein L32